MAIDARIRELDQRHRTLDEAIRRTTTQPATDSLTLREMKLRKLRLKDEMESLRGQHR